MNSPASPEIAAIPLTKIEKARALRKRLTPSEKMLWARLRGRRYAGIKFRRQQPVGKYIADYYCADAKIILELDGDSHAGREHVDARRDVWFASEGIKVIRVWDNEIFTNLDGVLELIFNTFRERQTFPLTPNPSPPLGRGEPDRGT